MVLLRIPPALKAELVAAAEADRRSVNAYLRNLVEDHLEARR